MFCSKCGAKAFGEYCFKCGAKILSENQSADEQSAVVQSASPAVLVKAKNCNAAIEMAKKRSASFMNIGILTAAIVMILPLLFSMFGKAAKMSSFPWGFGLLMLGAAAFIVVFTSKEHRNETAILDQYRRYCDKETLIVDEEKVYGTTKQGEVKMSYDQISSVVCTPCSINTRNIPAGSLCNKLTITTHDSAQHVFYSFSNCKELKTVIDSKLK